MLHTDDFAPYRRRLYVIIGDKEGKEYGRNVGGRKNGSRKIWGRKKESEHKDMGGIGSKEQEDIA